MSKEDATPEEGQEEIVEENVPTIEDAIEEAIVEVSPHLEEKDDEPNPDDDAGAAAGELDEEGAPDPDTANDKPADGEEAAADGADNADTDDKDGAGDSAGEAGDDGAEGAGGNEAEPDHINDPIPESTNEKTAERIQGLIEIARTQTERAGQGDDIVAAIQNSGSDPEQFSNTLGFLELYNSSDPAQRKQALDVARGVVHELSVELGEGSPDLISRHADLQAEVEAGTLDQARAIEIATGREQQALTTSRNKHASDTDDREAETTRLITLGKGQLSTFEESVKSDPDYARLRPAFIGVLQTTLRSTHASEWGATAQTIYNRLKASLPAATPTPKPAPQTPLRAQQGAGGGGDKKEEVKSAEEAVSAALADM